MNKIPTVFLRDDIDRRYVTREVNPDCAWVLAGQGIPTRKYDGTCIMFDGSHWWARREVKPGKKAPVGYVALSTDENTGKTVGWEPIEQSAFAKCHAEAIRTQNGTGISGWPAGTYELVGPKVNGNPERVADHRLWAHAAADAVSLGRERTFEDIRAVVLAEALAVGAEGIVFHHPDGRMGKIKARDFRSEGAA